MFLIATLLIATPEMPSSACAGALERARQAYGTYDVVTARRLYGESASPRCTAAEQADATTELARIDWLVDGDALTAARRLRSVMRATTDFCGAAHLIGRILNATDRSREVPVAIAPYASICADRVPAIALERVKAYVAVAAASNVDARPAAIGIARTAWETLPQLAQASLEGAKQKLAIGLLAGDPDEALTGWRAFFWLDDTNQPQGHEFTSDEIDERIRRGIIPGAATGDRAALCDMLIRAGFAAEARLVAGPLTSAVGLEWKRTRAYFAMHDRLSVFLAEHDQAYARGRRDGEAVVEERLLGILREAVAEAGDPSLDPWPALRRLWGLAGTTGSSNGVEGIHIGHVSVDVEQPIRQGRRVGGVRFVALDNMIANGFSGWLGDGITGPGGWAADGRIIQVRTRYVQTALDRAASAVEGPARDVLLRRLEASERLDIARVNPTAVDYLPSLSDRLQLRAIDTLAAELRRKPDAETSFHLRFARLWYARSFEGTILHHEGRHALDQAQYGNNEVLADAELEYRAKLSELRYSSSPRIMLSSIYGRLLGGTTGHGIANARLVGALAGWIDAHRANVAGYDSQVPALLQLWRLDDKQLAQIAASLDPDPAR